MAKLGPDNNFTAYIHTNASAFPSRDLSFSLAQYLLFLFLSFLALSLASPFHFLSLSFAFLSVWPPIQQPSDRQPHAITKNCLTCKTTCQGHPCSLAQQCMWQKAVSAEERDDDRGEIAVGKRGAACGSRDYRGLLARLWKQLGGGGGHLLAKIKQLQQNCLLRQIRPLMGEQLLQANPCCECAHVNGESFRLRLQCCLAHAS